MYHGLKGIEIVRKQENLTYIRPLKEITRKEIEQYCKENKLEPKIDKSNLENEYTRNKIRNLLIPYLEKEFNSNVIETINRLSRIALEEHYYFSEMVEKQYETLKLEEKENEIILDLKEYNKLPKVIKSRLILYTIHKLLGSTQGIEKVHIEDIILLCQRNIGNKFLSPKKGLKILVKNGCLHFIGENITISLNK